MTWVNLARRWPRKLVPFALTLGLGAGFAGVGVELGAVGGDLLRGDRWEPVGGGVVDDAFDGLAGGGFIGKDVDADEVTSAQGFLLNYGGFWVVAAALMALRFRKLLFL